MHLLLFLALELAGPLPPALPADAIMAKVASNQDRAQAERAQFVYQQRVKVVIRHAGGTLGRQETTDFEILPGQRGLKRKQQAIQGRYLKKKRYFDYNGEPVPNASGLDFSLLRSFRDDLTNDSNAKDGVSEDLFPLTSDEQKDLVFEKIGEETVEGRPAYRIRFAPREKHDFGWAGEALIDEAELQPVKVYTRLSRRLPVAVRTLLGTDVPGLGFSTRYRRIAPDIWFPVSFGTEFRVHAVFFLNRTISVSLENHDFRRTSAESTIRFADAAPK